MRECPKCHYVDPPNWRAPPFGPDFDYVRLDEFHELMPQVARELLGKGKAAIAYDELHAYRSSGKYVYRIWLPIWRAYNGETRSWADVRRTKMYDSAGRTDKKAWAKMLKVIGSRKKRLSLSADLASFSDETKKETD